MRAHQFVFQACWGMRCGVEKGFSAQPRESLRWLRRILTMRPSVLCLSFKSECAVEMSAVALVSFIDGSSVPYSVSGRNSRGDEHEVAMCIRFFMMCAILRSISFSSESSSGTTAR